MALLIEPRWGDQDPGYADVSCYGQRDYTTPNIDRLAKHLRIAGNEFLFDVVQDPRERANLKDRNKDVFDRLNSDWEAWNGTMLPERSRPATYIKSGNFQADRYGVINPAPAAPAGSAPTK